MSPTLFQPKRLVDPGASEWSFPPLDRLADTTEDLIAVGADLEPATILAAYASGYFPMPINRRQIGWFSPRERGVLHPASLRVSRSLRRSQKRFQVTVNEAFDEVLHGCADPARPQGWIDKRIRKAYQQLHEMGWVHSVEVWDDEGLAGGLYGVGIGGLFAGESMFHRRTDASKVALCHLVANLLDSLVDPQDNGVSPLIDTQWLTPHLASLGVETVTRVGYGALLAAACSQPGPFPVPGHGSP